ncbi:DUF4189 domain-containing protein [Stenotrophomonas indicatrix]|uniref:DUF4189 domain-containing protein n=2 Tax=Lysobacteraceae TaxID=32033 RepID=UPI0029587A6B|nr:DUF4189 domain-containing protein [Stenotrophomonas indicatrix]
MQIAPPPIPCLGCRARTKCRPRIPGGWVRLDPNSRLGVWKFVKRFDMKSIHCLAFIVALVSIACSSSVFAEGGSCPPGYYPIGGQGVSGCAPIPGANASQGADQGPALPPQPTGKWHSTWGSIAFSSSTSAAGVATGRYSQEDAEAEAKRKCGSEGAADCKLLLTYTNHCAVWVVPSTFGSGSRSGVAGGETLRLAKKSAEQQCVDSKGGKCSVFYSDCTKPEFEKY